MKQTKVASPLTRTTKYPGEVLLNQFMLPAGLTAGRLARGLHVTTTRVGEIINGRRKITAESALRLARFFGTAPNFWLNLQADYDLRQAEEEWAQIIDAEIRPLNGPNKDKQGKSRKQDEKLALSKLSVDQRKIFSLISDKPIHFDILVDKSGMHVGTLSATLTMLQLDGLVHRHHGDYYSLS